ncbi:type VI secretion system baseplate subunit TssE [Marivita sp.]|uniref:type VI secretion system baseplate subunit TssE n=1 Tax=Marivita sp. TaxID=2003365 RepID=UPI0025C627B5|nr:type VI secretion system baseplate subunit TssE [Marivita sp.]
MADRTLTERLQPSILDRLTDDDPKTETENVNNRVIDIRRLREIIQRDLSWLLNTGNLDSEIDPDQFPNVRRSVVNYGVPDSTGDYSTRARASDVRDAIRAAIELFEPRILDGSLTVISRSEDVGRESLIAFDIMADMWAEPVPAELYLRTQFDTTTGHITLEYGG